MNLEVSCENVHPFSHSTLHPRNVDGKNAANLQLDDILFSCCCQPCAENWPLLAQLPDFSAAEAAAFPDWAVQRVALQSAVDRLDLTAVAAICKELGRLGGHVQRPHAALVTPEAYMSLVHMLLHANRSIKFAVWLKEMQVK